MSRKNKAILLGFAAAVFMAVTMLFAGVSAKAAAGGNTIPFVPASGRGYWEQPTSGNNYKFVVTLDYPTVPDGTYKQAVRFVLREQTTNKANSYYEVTTCRVSGGSTLNPHRAPSWTVTSKFTKPTPGTYKIELYTVSAIGSETLVVESEPFTVSDSNHSCVREWLITKLGDANHDQVEEEVCLGCGGHRDNTRITTAYTNYLFESAILVNNATSDGVVSIYHDTYNTLSKSFMQVLALRRDITFNMYFVYGGQKYKTTIPAGTPIDTSYDWYGPALLMGLFPTEVINYEPATVVSYQPTAVSSAAAGSTVLLNKSDTYSRAQMQEIASRPDVNFVIRFTYNGVSYDVLIPAGTTIDTSCDWYGPLKLMSLYTTKVTGTI